MIVTVTWDSIFSRIGERAPRRGRARCPLHDGDSLQSLSVTEDKGGQYFCHVCHKSGDKIQFIRELYDFTFAEALAWFGLKPGRIPKPDPAVLRASRVRNALLRWRKFHLKRIGKLIFELNQTQVLAAARLEKNSDDEKAWIVLEIVHKKYPQLETIHNSLLSNQESDQIEAFRFLEGA